MDPLSLFLSTFFIVFVGELGDKTQIAAGTGTLANKGRVKIIFLSSVAALVAASALTTLLAGIIPDSLLPIFALVGGMLMAIYGTHLFRKNEDADAEDVIADKRGLALFFSHFFVVLIAEMGDKSQIFTAGVAIQNNEMLLTVFAASASALIIMTVLTVWGATKISKRLTARVQKIGAIIMVFYGAYMIYGGLETIF